MPALISSTKYIHAGTAMGVDMEALQDTSSDYVKALNTIKVAISQRPQTPLYAFDIIYNILPAGRKHNQAIQLVHQFAYKVHIV